MHRLPDAGVGEALSSRAMIAPFSTREPSLTLSTASRPGIFAETAASVRATT